MRRRLALPAAIGGTLGTVGALAIAFSAAIGAVATAPAGAQPPGSQQPSGAQSYKCAQKIYSQTSGSLKGFDFGVMLCTGPFGTGVQADNYSESVRRGGLIVSKGTFHDYFDAGSVKGTYTLSGRFTSPTSGHFTGPLKITGGSGSYAGILGSGKLSCATSNAGKTDHCLMSVTEAGD